jgi:hypothetical protein
MRRSPSVDDRADVDAPRAREAAPGTPDQRRPDLAVIVPVNAQGDLGNVRVLLEDVARYRGPHAIERILVVNNFPDGQEPPEVEELRRLGLVVLAIPDVRRPGEAVGFSARIPGLRAASAECAVLFDADCRVPHATTLLNWYVEQFRRGAHAAYTPVRHRDFEDALSVRVCFAIHHSARWVKRRILRIPTTRGSNYAVRCQDVLELYDQGLLADEMNVGPTVKRFKGRVAYASGKRLTVLTSGRMWLQPTWRRIVPYFLYRLRYNLRVLPVRPGVARFTGRENDPVRRYRDNRPVRGEG